jgi:hypothetical protein
MALRLTIYSRPGCHLCEIMAAVVRHVSRTVPLTLDEIDITTDAALLARYETAIPVLAVEDREVARYRVREEELRRILTQAGEDRAG